MLIKKTVVFVVVFLNIVLMSESVNASSTPGEWSDKLEKDIYGNYLLKDLNTEGLDCGSKKSASAPRTSNPRGNAPQNDGRSLGSDLK